MQSTGVHRRRCTPVDYKSRTTPQRRRNRGRGAGGVCVCV